MASASENSHCLSAISHCSLACLASNFRVSILHDFCTDEPPLAFRVPGLVSMMQLDVASPVKIALDLVRRAFAQRALPS